ncbi:MAG: imidazoleglycerol-phosphate dehydratase HisB [Acidimicrobiia bacterium]
MTRTAHISRVTTETTVEVSIDLDGTGRAEVATGIGMLDHLVNAFAHHSLIDVVLTTTGDLHVDDHHTVEDTMLTLGEAIDSALGDRSGISRYGDARVPMDESVAACAIDVGGRAYAVITASFHGERLGGLSTQMIGHAFEAFSRSGRLTLHIEATGRNDHHIAEAMFKALARATRKAVTVDDRRVGVPSTKGSM